MTSPARPKPYKPNPLTFVTSPAHTWFGHRVSNGMIDAVDARIFWDMPCLKTDRGAIMSGTFRIANVTVILHPADIPADHPLWDWTRYLDHDRDFFPRMSSGNVFRDWMLPEYTEVGELYDPCDTHHSPGTVWRHLLDIGFADEAEARRAMLEFAHINECAWARTGEVPEAKGWSGDDWKRWHTACLAEILEPNPVRTKPRFRFLDLDELDALDDEAEGPLPVIDTDQITVRHLPKGFSAKDIPIRGKETQP